MNITRNTAGAIPEKQPAETFRAIRPARIILLVTVLCLLLGCAFAEPVNAVPAVGDRIAGFTVTGMEDYAPLDARVVYLTHDRTGSPVIWIANDDTERSFNIGFRTHYDVDNGVPHAFEHLVLDRNAKYPDPICTCPCSPIYARHT